MEGERGPRVTGKSITRRFRATGNERAASASWKALLGWEEGRSPAKANALQSHDANLRGPFVLVFPPLPDLHCCLLLIPRETEREKGRQAEVSPPTGCYAELSHGSQRRGADASIGKRGL